MLEDRHPALNTIMARRQPRTRAQKGAAKTKAIADVGKALAKADAKVIVDGARRDAETGRFLRTLTPERQNEALERIAAGESVLTVCESFGLSRGALHRLARYDSAFARELELAMSLGVYTSIDIAERRLAGEEGFTTGDVYRDAKCADFARWKAAKFNRKVFGDKLEVESKSLVINIVKDDLPDWS